MSELYFKKLKEKFPFTDEDIAFINSHIIHKKLRKKQYLLQAGDICKYAAFVEKGSLRAYTIDDKGSEHIIQFAVEGWTISDMASFQNSEPATYNIDALEDSELLLMDKASQEIILSHVPNFEKYMRLQLTGAYVAMQKRLSSIISASLEERYTSFIQLYPSIAQRVPQHMIASYMGLTPETLSRIRKKMNSK